MCAIQKILLLYCEWHSFLGKQLYIYTIDLSHDSAHKNIKVQLP